MINNKKFLKDYLSTFSKVIKYNENDAIKFVETLKILTQHNIFPTIADARFVKPLDFKLIDTLLNNHKYIFTFEEGSEIGGFGSEILKFYNLHNKQTSI